MVIPPCGNAIQFLLSGKELMQFPPDDPIFEGARLSPPRCKQSSLLFFVTIVAGGGMGLLAGYGALTLISGKVPLQGKEPGASNESESQDSVEPKPKLVRHAAAPAVRSIEDDSAPQAAQIPDAASSERLQPLPSPKAASPTTPPADSISNGAKTKPITPQP